MANAQRILPLVQSLLHNLHLRFNCFVVKLFPQDGCPLFQPPTFTHKNAVQKRTGV